jgi:hypothetical protein
MTLSNALFFVGIVATLSAAILGLLRGEWSWISWLILLSVLISVTAHTALRFRSQRDMKRIESTANSAFAWALINS